MKNKKKEYIADSEEINYINNSRTKKISKNTKLKCTCFNCILIFIVILLIINLYCIIQILFQQKIIINNQKKFTDNNNDINFYAQNSKSTIINNEKTFSKEQKETNNFKTENFNENLQMEFSNIETFDLNILEPIESKLFDFIELTTNEQRFFNGILRKVKPKKIVEIGVSSGGSSALILNAIKDIEGAKLYSIDKSKKSYKDKNKDQGFFAKENFPELMDKWDLNIGGITSEFIEKIGGDIDLVFIDTMHITPGEMLDWLQVLPFLKEGAFVVFHDAFFMYWDEKVKKSKLNCSNNQLLSYIRGELILPSYGNSTFFRNIGALKLSKDQKKYYKQYFLALGTQWEYMPEENHLKIMREFFMKYYGEKYVEIYDDAVKKNKIHLNLY